MLIFKNNVSIFFFRTAAMLIFVVLERRKKKTNKSMYYKHLKNEVKSNPIRASPVRALHGSRTVRDQFLFFCLKMNVGSAK